MAQHESIDGLIIRTRDMGDHDRYLTVLTAAEGRITLLAKGGRGLRGAQVPVSQLYTYANFEFYQRGAFKILKGGNAIESFYGLSEDLDRLNLAAYFCEVAYELSDDGEPAGDLLRLALNSLHAVSRNLYPQKQIKGAFEIRAAALSGYAPDLSGCRTCKKTQSHLFYLDVMNGSLICPECLSRAGGAVKTGAYADELREAEILSRMPAASVAAVRYCISAPLNRLFAFELSEEDDWQAFTKLTELYLLSHIGHGFESLRFYHEMRGDVPRKKEGN
ncbi:MAG: DNA repair protein RecO [Ruminococcaceae bacterium]|nr:DNA repair protein RecO [Oscillospiraceae bacterium]